MGSNSPFLTEKDSTLEAEQQSEMFQEHKESISSGGFSHAVTLEAELLLNPDKVRVSNLSDAYDSIYKTIAPAIDPQSEDNDLLPVCDCDITLGGADELSSSEDDNLYFYAKVELSIPEEYEIKREEIIETAQKRWASWIEKMNDSNYVEHAENTGS